MSDVSVIVPTQALAQRASCIRAALQSILSQQQVRSFPIVVVNGSDADPGVIDGFRSEPRITLIFRDRPGIPMALRAGRERVTTPYVTTLDDDDQLLPGGLAARVTALEAHPEWDGVVTNGIVRKGEAQAIKNPDTEVIRQDPVHAMLDRNWILPGGWLFRTDALPPEVFDAMPDHLECTYLALWMATQRRIGFLDVPTLIRVKDSPAASSQTEAFLLGQARAHRQLLTLDLAEDVKLEIQRRITAACHSASRYCMSAGAHADAWSWHFRTLREPGGWRYLRYTGRLVLTKLGLLK